MTRRPGILINIRGRQTGFTTPITPPPLETARRAVGALRSLACGERPDLSDWQARDGDLYDELADAFESALRDFRPENSFERMKHPASLTQQELDAHSEGPLSEALEIEAGAEGRRLGAAWVYWLSNHELVRRATSMDLEAADRSSEDFQGYPVITVDDAWAYVVLPEPRHPLREQRAAGSRARIHTAHRNIRSEMDRLPVPDGISEPGAEQLESVAVALETALEYMKKGAKE